jgi:hypothetical protein
VEANARTSLLFKCLNMLVLHINVLGRRVLPLLLADQKNAGIIKRLVDYRFIKSLLHGVRVVVRLKDNIVAEKKRMD